MASPRLDLAALVLALAGMVVLLSSGSAPVEVAGSPGAPDRTPLSCDGKPADFHAERAKRVARKAYDHHGADSRILDPYPAKDREREAWRKHARCLLDRERRERIGRYPERREAAFRAFFARLIGEPSNPGSAWLRSTASCESGTSGDTQAVSPGGTYQGRYQFDARSWAATAATYARLTGLAPTSSRTGAPAREQDIRAAIWYRSAGAGAWHVCG
jgi:hypothetical protein